MDRMKKVSKVFDGTLNDIVLAIVAGALRKLLISQNELPDLSLKAQAPVNVRREGDVDSGNVIAFIIADLATNIAEPVDRLRAIQQSMLAGKETLGNLSSREAALFAQITHLPMLFTSLLGVNEKFPAYSTVVSNVPGPKKPLYLNGARMTGVYPAGIVMNGFATSIIIVSYDGKMNFGITACRKSVPKAQRIIDYMEESLVELEQAAGLAPAKAKRAPRKKAAKTKAIPMDHLINP
jgi:diacylglycerol O-acyltransferase